MASSVGDIQLTILTMSRGSHEEDAAGKEGDDLEEIGTNGANYSGVDLALDMKSHLFYVFCLR